MRGEIPFNPDPIFDSERSSASVGLYILAGMKVRGHHVVRHDNGGVFVDLLGGSGLFEQKDDAEQARQKVKDDLATASVTAGHHAATNWLTSTKVTSLQEGDEYSPWGSPDTLLIHGVTDGTHLDAE